MTTKLNDKKTDAHRLDLRVYYENTDAGGIVYHADYLAFAERGRTEMLRDRGFAHAKLFAEQGVAFAVRAMNIDYQAPAKLDDLLSVESSVEKMGGASMTLKQKVMRDEKVLAILDVTLVCIDAQGRAVRIPNELRELFVEAGV